MKNLIFILSAALIASCLFAFQSKDNSMLEFNFQEYEAEWKMVDSLERQGLPESALKQVEKIYEQAKADNNAPQWVKSVIYKAKYTKTLEEKGQVAAIALVEKEAEAAKFPVQPILQSMAAQLYDQYLSNNYWRIQNRTEVVDNDSEDMETWTMARLLEKSSELYKKSIEREELKRLKADDFKAILTEGKESEGLRPTIYDVLAFRAIDHFTNERSYLTQPANKFYIDNEEAFALSKGFVKTQFQTEDQTSFKYQTLLLFQDIIAFHLKDSDPSALIDANLKRLKFVHQNAVLGDKDKLYLAALDEVIEEHEQNAMIAEAYYQKAQFYYQQEDEIDPTTGEAKVANWKMAHEICEAAIEKYPDSFGAKECKRLIVSIESKSLSFKAEQVNLPDEPFLIKIQHANVAKAHFKLIEVDTDDFVKYSRMNYDDQLKKLNKQKAVRKWNIQLPQAGDFRQHTVEAKVEALPLGTYVLMMANDSDFGKETLTSYVFFGVSNIAYWTREKRGEGNDFVLFNRKTGEPMQGVTATFYAQNYDRILRQNKLRRFDTKVSDRNGFIASQTGERYFQVKFTKGEDELFFGDGFSNYRSSNQRKAYQQTHFFLDRAIYRPGQTVYFKAIVLEKYNENMPRILTNEVVTITLHDANYQEVEQLQLTTNEYGTVNASFTAPSGGLLGNMSLQSSAGKSQQNFRVEEYKRPKFAVQFEPIQESFKLDEQVTVKGNAQAFAGNNIDGAKVQYRVVRDVRYPWIPWWYRRYYPRSESMEIKNGETKTDANGQFEVEFPALPDRSTDAAQKPEFIFTIYADVIDITGETHSAQTEVKVGTIALQADISLENRIEISDFDSLAIMTKNLNGQFEAAKGTITIQSLAMPDQIYIGRYWQQPDQYLMSEKEFKKAFPNYAYKTENEIQNWAVQKTILESDFDTEQSKQLALGSKKWKAGAYVLTMKTQDRYGQAVELKKHFVLYDWAKKDLALTEIGWSELDKNRYEPEETAELQIATATDELMVLFELEKDQKIVEREWIKVTDFATKKMQIEESDRGNFHYHLSYGKYNRTTNTTQTVVVPWSNKELKIEYATFRDKLKPGQEEEWQIKISGPKGEKVAAEMVATMYDASLDQFVGHNWALNPFPTAGYSYLGMNARHFNQVGSKNVGRYYRPDVEAPYRQYPALNLFGYGNYYGEEVIAFSAEPRGGVLNRFRSMAKSESMSAESAPPPPPPPPAKEMEVQEETLAMDAGDVAYGEESDNRREEMPTTDFSNIQVRTNLNETVFFMPELKTDKDGNIILKFTMNEALTKWKFLGLAHTQDLEIATTQQEVRTQKELMVQPNAPRFMREGDRITFTAKVSNLTEQAMAGSAMIELLDATTMQPVESLFALKNAEQNFTAEAGQSARLAWTLEVPSVAKVPALTHRIIAKSGNFSDAEESTLPILTNRMLVTETMPLPIRGKKQKDFTFASLANSNESNTLEHQ
ncbi:MAG: alpha-2-macroglobulin family protein, partial [Bacteroidota bacterium]